MTTNRLAKSSDDFHTSHLTAAQFAALAREAGNLDKARAWDRRAKELGEERIPNGITVRFNSDKTTRLVSLADLRKPPVKRDILDRRGEQMSVADTQKLNDTLETLGATARYRSDGSRYMVTA